MLYRPFCFAAITDFFVVYFQFSLPRVTEVARSIVTKFIKFGQKFGVPLQTNFVAQKHLNLQQISDNFTT